MLGGRRCRVARFRLYLRARRPGAEFNSLYSLTKISIRYLMSFPKEK
jgi:hypothetical protein